MKSIPFNLMAIICIFFVVGMLVSCSTSRLKSLKLEAKETSPELFIKTLNGEVITFETKDKIQFDLDSISAMQDKYSYKRVEKGISYERMYKGPMNLYYRYVFYPGMEFNPAFGYTSDNHSKSTLYFDLGADRPLIFFTYDSLLLHTKNCLPCHDVLRNYDQTHKRLNTWKFINWGAIAASIVIVATSEGNSELSDLQAYSFAGLFFGGIISGVYRSTRVNKNQTRLLDIVKAYNTYKY